MSRRHRPPLLNEFACSFPQRQQTRPRQELQRPEDQPGTLWDSFRRKLSGCSGTDELAELPLIDVLFTFPSMSRRTTPQKKIDDLAFPVRVKLAIPDNGLGCRLEAINSWLKSHMSSGDFACHSHEGLTCGTLAIYFRSVRDAASFSETFTDLTLADGTLSPAYSTPSRRAGR